METLGGMERCIFAVWQVSPTLFFRKEVNFRKDNPSFQILPAVGCFTGYALKMFMPIVYFDSIANFDTQYASSGFGDIIKKEILIGSQHAVHVFFWP